MIRLFAAVEVPDGIVERLGGSLRNVRPRFPGVKWTPEGPMHLTLLFLGDQEEGTVDGYRKAFRRAATRVRPFPMELGGLGAFPSLDRPRVLLVPALVGGEEFSRLAAALAREASEAGLASGGDREVLAHLTLGRVRDAKADPGLWEALEKAVPASLGTFQVERFFLFQSRLLPSGAVHTKLGEIALG